MPWILIVAVGGWVGLSDVRLVALTERQCRTALAELEPLKPRIGTVCVGPDGEAAQWGE